MIEVLVQTSRVAVDPTPGTNAGEIGAAVAAAHNIRGDVFTLKADGVVLAPSDSIEGHNAPFELIEHVPEPDTSHHIPVTDPTPDATVIKVGKPAAPIARPAKPAESPPAP